MENSGEIYRQLLERVRESFPDLAQQVEDEVGQGRRLTAKGLPASEWRGRSEKMRKTGSRLAEEDLAAVGYTDDERLLLLIDALRRLATSMASARQALIDLLAGDETDLAGRGGAGSGEADEGDERPDPPRIIVFRSEESPDDELGVPIDVTTRLASEAKDVVDEGLREVLEDLKS